MLQNLKLSFILPQLTEHGDQSLQDVTAQWGSTCKEIYSFTAQKFIVG